MSTPPASDQPAGWSQSGADQYSPYHEHYHGLPLGSYTDQKLRYSSAHHLHMTSRRFFIGPIPKGWLQGHRKSWYRSRLRFKNYTSKSISFSADPIASHYDQQDPRAGSPSPALEGDIALTVTNASEEAEREHVAESGDPETEEESSGELRMLSHPMKANGNDDALEAPSESEEDSDATPRPSTAGRSRPYGNRDASSSYVTAREEADTWPPSSSAHIKGLAPGQRPKSQESQNLTVAGSSYASQLSPHMSAGASDADSTTQLLQRCSKAEGKLKNKASRKSFPTMKHQDPQDEGDAQQEGTGREAGIQRRFTKQMGKLNLDDNLRDRQQKLRMRIARTQDTVFANRPRRQKVQDGEIVKAERMLVRVEETLQKKLPTDYTENDSLRMETRIVDRWREFLVVCRKSAEEHTPFVIQMYRTRVIPDIQRAKGKTPPYHEVRLNHKNTSVNLYSSLDKTIVIWHPRRQGAKIYIIRPKSAAHAAEWYTFIRQVLGWRRPSSIPIHVPDLGVSLVFKHPFGQLEANLRSTEEDAQNSAVTQQAERELRIAAAAIIQGCLEMLEDRPEWAEVLKTWSKTEKLGLAWKRYDRLEWVFGINEEKMYGTIAMQSSHELELRPRHHYPTTVRHGVDNEEEPYPVEGFLVRLTSQKGVHQRRNKMFFKRLYFFTEDHYLLFCRPAKAYPPTPPKLAQTEDCSVPSSHQILDEMPLTWDINPYPLQNGQITWLSSGSEEYVQRHDEEAYAQMQRNVHNISEADGYVNFCHVKEVRNLQWGSSPADLNIREGSAVDFNPEPRDTRQDDGATRQFDDDRTFEMSLENGLVIRLQAYDTAMRDEWVKRLSALVKYWRTRYVSDAAELQVVRARNLELLEIDEETESMIGQFAKKWEVKKAEASPHLHNMCAMSGCRTIKMSGLLFRKPRRHALFNRSHVILTSGKLLIFHSTLRKGNGVMIPHIHQELDTAIDLRNCYIYSGLITEDDLLYGNQTFDSNNPGHHALPRVYLSADAFTTQDEDTAITFVIWQPLKKNYFRAQEKGAEGKIKRSLRHVSTLGKHGRTIVFKARSRVEKDRWVMSISSEIDRLQEETHEDIRIVSP